MPPLLCIPLPSVGTGLSYREIKRRGHGRFRAHTSKQSTMLTRHPLVCRSSVSNLRNGPIRARPARKQNQHAFAHAGQALGLWSDGGPSNSRFPSATMGRRPWPQQLTFCAGGPAPWMIWIGGGFWKRRLGRLTTDRIACAPLAKLYEASCWSSFSIEGILARMVAPLRP